MLTAPIFTLLLLAAQPAPADERARFAACLDTFLAAQRQERAPVESFANALANACTLEEHAYRQAHAARGIAAGTAYLAADDEAHRTALDLRIRARTVYLTAQQACRR